jgi:hypothetical protein
MNGLTRRVEALEQVTAVMESLPCVDCGIGHLFEVLSLDRISARYEGSEESVPAICECACCAPVLCDLVGRFEAVDGAA